MKFKVNVELEQKVKTIRVMEEEEDQDYYHLVQSNTTFLINLKVPEKPDDIVDELIGSMKFWLDNFVNNSIIVSPIFSDDFSNATNPVILCPGQPDDILMAVLILAKLRALGSGIIKVNSIRIKSNTSYGFQNTISGDLSDILPTIDNWMGERRFFDQAWWDRNDISTMDVDCGPDQDPKKPPEGLGIKIKDLLEGKEAEVIKHNFKPVIINGDSE